MEEKWLLKELKHTRRELLKKMLADDALKLVVELKRHHDNLSHFNTETVSNVQREIRHLFAEYQDLNAPAVETNSAQNDGTRFATLTSHIVAIQRNIRCLLSYNHHRVAKLCDVVMANRADGAGRRPPPVHIRDKLNANEHSFYSEYSKLLHRYKVNFDDLFDLTGSVLPPPQSVYIQVRALRDLDFETDDGRRIKICTGHTDFVKRCDIEKYIELGYLVHVE